MAACITKQKMQRKLPHQIAFPCLHSGQVPSQITSILEVINSLLLAYHCPNFCPWHELNRQGQVQDLLTLRQCRGQEPPCHDVTPMPVQTSWPMQTRGACVTLASPYRSQADGPVLWHFHVPKIVDVTPIQIMGNHHFTSRRQWTPPGLTMPLYPSTFSNPWS